MTIVKALFTCIKLEVIVLVWESVRSKFVESEASHRDEEHDVDDQLRIEHESAQQLPLSPQQRHAERMLQKLLLSCLHHYHHRVIDHAHSQGGIIGTEVLLLLLSSIPELSLSGTCLGGFQTEGVLQELEVHDDRFLLVFNALVKDTLSKIRKCLDQHPEWSVGYQFSSAKKKTFNKFIF